MPELHMRRDVGLALLVALIVLLVVFAGAAA
jgi:Tfp pilus assembly protein PilX